MTDAPAPPVLIVVPTLDEAPHIARVIDSLLSSAPQGARLVVADGGSRDATRAIVRDIATRDPRVHLIDNPARLQSAGINLAVHRFGTDGGVLIRADAHARYPARFCTDLLIDAATRNAAAITVPMDTCGETPFTRATAAAQNSWLGTGGSAHRAGKGGAYVDHGHHALMQIADFRALGGYDPAQSHNEDAELDHRLRATGRRIWLSDRTRIAYLPRASFAGLFAQYRNHGRGRAMTVRKHAMPLRLRQMLPLATPFAALGLALGVALSLAVPHLTLPGVVLALPGLVWVTACMAGGALLALRHRDPAVLLAGPAALVMHLAWGVGFLAEWLRPHPRARQ